MWTLELPWETWRAMIDYLRGTGLAYAREHADLIERQLDQHPTGEDPVRLTFPENVFYLSITLACVALRIPMPTGS